MVLEKIARDGFAIIPDVLSVEQVSQHRELLDEVAARERENGTAWFSHSNQRIFNLLSRGHLFAQLTDHESVLPVVEAVLGHRPLLSSITANVALPGNEAQQLHADQGYVTEPWDYIAAVQVVWMIDDFVVSNGATRVVAKSHRLRRAPILDNPVTTAIEGSAGSVAILDGRVWHGTGKFLADQGARRGIFAYYCVPFLRQQENFALSLDGGAVEGMSLRQRELVGRSIWQGLGQVDGLPRAWMGRSSRTGFPSELGDEVE